MEDEIECGFKESYKALACVKEVFGSDREDPYKDAVTIKCKVMPLYSTLYDYYDVNTRKELMNKRAFQQGPYSDQLLDLEDTWDHSMRLIDRKMAEKALENEEPSVLTVGDQFDLDMVFLDAQNGGKKDLARTLHAEGKVRVIIVIYGSVEDAQVWKKDLDLGEVPIWISPDREFHRRMGLKRTVQGSLNLVAPAFYAGLKKANNGVLKRPGDITDLDDPYQTGSDIVLDPCFKITFVHKTSNMTDRPTIDELRKFLN